MSRIYWDTMVYAYWFEQHPAFGQRVDQIQKAMTARGDVLCGSLFVMSELLVGPVQQGTREAIAGIEQYFQNYVTLLSYNQTAVKTFTALRAHHGVKPFDALHLAIAATSGVDLFLTHDRRLQKLNMPGLPLIASLETDVL